MRGNYFHKSTFHLYAMKKSLLLLLLSILQAALLQAATYYVSPAGNDANTGLTTAAPWLTINKVNASMPIFLPGDSILFERNGVFAGAVVIGVSGSSGHPVVFGAYGAGSNPVIRGDTVISSWVADGPNIWKCSYGTRPQALYINNDPQQIARYPNRYGTANGGYLTYSSYSGDTMIVSSTPLSNIWTGAEVVIRIERYILQPNIVRYQAGAGDEEIHFTPSVPQTFTQVNFGLFFQNDTTALDLQGEWCYQNGNVYLYSTIDPSSLVISVSKYNYAVNCKSQNYITFQNLTVEDADSANVLVSMSGNVTIDSCTLTQAGFDGVDVTKNSASFTCENSTLMNLPSDGIYLVTNNPDALIENNEITNCGTVPGMGANIIDACCNAVYFDGTGSNFLCRNNYCDSIGRHGISLKQDSSSMSIQNNYIDHVGMVFEDLGGIHILGKATAVVLNTSTIQGNIIVNGVGTPYGTSDSTDNGFTHGIYLDQYTKKYLVTDNTIANMPGNGIEMHNTQWDTLSGNTMFGNGAYEEIITPGAQIFLVNQGAYPDDSGIQITHNILVALDTNQKVLTLYESSHTGNACATYSSYDSNYYCHPFFDTSDMIYVDDVSASINAYYGLAAWSAYAGDFYSRPAPKYYASFSRSDSVLLIYNNTQSVQTYPLPAGNAYIDVYRTPYSGSVTLSPYTSVVLFYAGISTTGSTNITNTGNEGALLVYPNPNNGHFSVDAQGWGTNGFLDIYNLPGQKVYGTPLTGPGWFPVDLSNQPGGIYFLHFINDQGAIVKKIIIEK